MRFPKTSLPFLAVALLAASCGATPSTTVANTEPTTTSTTEPDAPETTQITDGAETAAVTVTGSPLPEANGGGILDTAELDAAIGTIAPTLSGTNFQGESVSITADGRPKAIYFLAHWCPHCQDEVTLLKELIAAGDKPDDIDIYGVTIAVRDDQDNYPPSAWMDDFPGTVMRDSSENEAAIASGVSGIPYVIYLDGENTLLSRSIGSLTADQVRSQWRSLLPQSS